MTSTNYTKGIRRRIWTESQLARLPKSEADKIRAEQKKLGPIRKPHTDLVTSVKARIKGEV